MSYYNKNLRVNEIIIKIVRKYNFTYLGGLIVCFFFLTLPFFLLYLLFQWKKTGLAIFFLLLLVGIVLLIRNALNIYYNKLVITNQRLIYYKQKGVFHRWVNEVFLDKIQDLSYEIKGFWQMIFKYGNLNIQVINSNTVLKIEKIKSPEKIQDLINQIKENNLINENNGKK